MRLAIEVAGHVGGWEFAGGPAFEAWLAARPWERGGVRRVALGGPSIEVAFREALDEGARRYDRAGSAIRSDVLRPGNSPSAWQWLAAHLGVSEKARDWRREVREVLGERPRLLVVIAPNLDPARLAELDGIVQAVRQDGASVPAFVVVSTPHGYAPQGADDFVTGLPSRTLLDAAEISEGSLWRSYVHLRLAWESAGCPDRAKRWLSGLEVPDQPDDAWFEQLLNRSADSETASTRRWLDRLGAAILRDAARPGLTPIERHELMACGLLWRPAPGAAPRPSPFAARALASRPGFSDLLRPWIVCAPLARELLSKCFDAEQFLRLRYWNTSRTLEAPEKLRARIGDLSNPESVVAALYPRGCRIVPESGWSVAGLGDLVTAFGPRQRGLPAEWQLTHLRNALAHGHYVTWAAVRVIRYVSGTIASTVLI